MTLEIRRFAFMGTFALYFVFLILMGQTTPLHWFYVTAFFSLYFLHPKTRYLLLLFLPFVLKDLLYDTLHWIPFSFLEPIHLAGPYNLERFLFGIRAHGAIVTIPEFLQSFHHPLLDLMTGIAYTLYDFLPLIATIFLWQRKGSLLAWRFAVCFFVMNFFAYATYVLYPVAPPWYVEIYGLSQPTSPVLGNAAGLVALEQMMGSHFISHTYATTGFVFGAIPSMHVGYACLIFFYLFPLVRRQWAPLFLVYIGLVSFGALYLNHHYLIDVLLGALYAFGSIAVSERWLHRPSERLFELIKPIFLSPPEGLLWNRVKTTPESFLSD